MKTLKQLNELGIKKLSLKSSITRRFLSYEELKEIKKDGSFVMLFNLMHSKRNQIINYLKSERDFYFSGEKIDITLLSFLK